MKIKKQIILISLLTVSLLIGLKSCKEEQATEPSQQIIIFGKINPFLEFPLNSTIELSYFDFIIGEELIYIDSLEEDGSFKFIFDKHLKQDVLIKYHNSSITLMVTPGVNITIELDAHEMIVPQVYYNKSNSTIKLSGRDTIMNNQIIHFMYHLQPIINDKPQGIDYVEINEPNIFKEIVLEYHKNMLDIYNEYIDLYPTEQLITKWSKNYIDYECSTILTNFTFQITRSNPEYVMPDIYYDYFESFKLDIEEASNCSKYGSHLNEYRKYIKFKYLPESSKVFKSGGAEAGLKFVLDKLIQDTKGFARDIILAQEFFEVCKANRFDLYEKYYPRYKDKIERNLIRSMLELRYNNAKQGLGN